MTETLSSEHELATFLEEQERETLATWQRQRTSNELVSFVEQRFAALEDVA